MASSTPLKLRDYSLPANLNNEEDNLLKYLYRTLHPSWNYTIFSDATDTMRTAGELIVTPNALLIDKQTIIYKLFFILQSQRPDDIFIPHEIDVALRTTQNMKMKYLKYKAKYIDLKLSRKNTV